MNKLISLLLLSLLVSCNDNLMRRATITNHEVVVDHYKSGLSVDRGIVAIIERAGNEISLDVANKQVNLVRVSQITKSVVIHVDGENVYRYVETKNNLTGAQTRKVVYDVMNPKKELSNILNNNLGTLSGDTLILKGTNFNEEESEEYAVHSSDSYIASFDLRSSICDSTNKISSESIVSFNGSADKKINTEINETSVCGTRFTKAQIKAIDLKSISLCSDVEQNGETFEDCGASGDQSWLTADLN